MSGMMNSFYYGKAGKADFTPENLPANRVQLFFEMLRVRFSALFGVNFLYLLFCIPAIVWTAVNVMILFSAMDPEAAGMAIDFIGDGYMTIYLLGMVPCLALCGIGATGEMYILRNWARDQHSFVWSDFKEAIKGNWKRGLVVGLINGASLLVTYVCYYYYGGMSATGSVLWVIPQSFVVICCVFWWMMQMLIFPMMVTYEMKLSQLTRNCAIMTLARLPWSVLMLLGTFGIPVAVVLLIPSNIAILVVVLLYLLIGFALTGLIYASYANSCFDKYLNPRIEGAPVNMGLRDEEYIEDDEEAEES